MDILLARENLEGVMEAGEGAVPVAQRALKAPAYGFAEQQDMPA